MIDVGWLGSPVDVGTFVMVTVLFVYRMKPRVQLIAAAVVALAEGRDDDRLRDELDVDEQVVDLDFPPLGDDGAGAAVVVQVHADVERILDAHADHLAERPLPIREPGKTYLYVVGPPGFEPGSRAPKARSIPG